MIHFLQFMNFGSGVTFYKGQAKVQNGYHPTCTFCKINFYHLKAEQTFVKDNPLSYCIHIYIVMTLMTIRTTIVFTWNNHTADIAIMQPHTSTETEIQMWSLIHNCTLKEHSAGQVWYAVISSSRQLFGAQVHI